MNSQAAAAEVNASIQPQAKGGCLQQDCYPSINHVLDALESMADQYLQIKDKEGRKRYDHVFMSAGESCLDVLIAAGRIPSWMDYREGGEPPSTDNTDYPERISGITPSIPDRSLQRKVSHVIRLG